MSNLVYSKAVESTEKFDYFLVSVIGAITAYSLQSYKPAMLGLNIQTMEATALLILVLAFFAGMKRIEYSAVMVKANLTAVRSREVLTAVSVAWDANQEDLIFQGERIYRRNMEALYESQKGEGEIAERVAAFAGPRGGFYLAWRDRLLFAGFSVLFASKILMPYNVPKKVEPTTVSPAVEASEKALVPVDGHGKDEARE